MKKNIFMILLIVLALAAVTFCVLWQDALHDKSDLEAFAQAAANEAYTYFLDFQEKGYNSDYWGGVAAFHAFQGAYRLLTEGTAQSENLVFCNEVYGSLLLSPEQAKAHISDVIAVMEILSENGRDENGFLRMSELRNVLRQ